MSSGYLGEGFDRGLRQVGCVIVLLLVAALVAAFFLGRCSAKYEVKLQSPVVTKEAP